MPKTPARRKWEKAVQKALKKRKTPRGAPYAPGQSGGADTAYQGVTTAVNDFASMAEKLRISNVPAGSMSGSFGDLANDIVGLVDSAINAVVDTVQFAATVVNTPSNLGRRIANQLAKHSLHFKTICR